MVDLKIALISHDFPPSGFGGIAVYTHNLASALAKKGIDVTVFCGEKKSKNNKDNDEKFCIKRYNMPDIPPRSLWFQLSNRKDITRELNKFDLINTQYTSGYFLLKNIKKPIITTFHDSPKKEFEIYRHIPFGYWTPGEFVYNILEYPIYHMLSQNEIKISDNVISTGKSLTNDLKNEFMHIDNKLITIQNGINLSKFKGIESSEERDNILFFGRLYYRKGIIDLLDAFEIVCKKNKNAVLDIFGDGPLSGLIKERAIKNKRIGLFSSVSHGRMLQILSMAKIVVLPSIYEAFSLAFLETMALGKVLITYDYPFSSELIVNKKTGIMVERKNIEQLATKIDSLLNDSALRKKIGANSKKYVYQNHDLNKIVNRYIEVYEKNISDYENEL